MGDAETQSKTRIDRMGGSLAKRSGMGRIKDLGGVGVMDWVGARNFSPLPVDGKNWDVRVRLAKI